MIAASFYPTQIVAMDDWQARVDDGTLSAEKPFLGRDPDTGLLTGFAVPPLTSDSVEAALGFAPLDSALLQSGTFSTPAAGLLLEQTGDVYGGSRFALTNHGTFAGAILSNQGLDLCDLALQANSTSTVVLRWEHRADSTLAANTTGELEVQYPSSAQTILGDGVIATGPALVGVNTASPAAQLHTVGSDPTQPVARFDMAAGASGEQIGLHDSVGVAKYSVDSAGVVQAQGYKSSDGSAGITDTIPATATLTVKSGLITGWV